LGGIGPEATGEFYNKLIHRLQEKKLIKSNRDFPQIVINSIPAPELIYDKISDEELRPYINGLKELDKFGVDFIVMVCNTIHLYYEKLQREINTPILDLRKEVRKMLKRNGIKSVLIIGTPNTIKQGLYRFEGIKTFEPNKIEMKLLTNAIFDFNRGVKTRKEIEKVKSICEKYISKGAEAIVLACTELALMLDKQEFPIINTIDVLVDATIRKFLHIRSVRKFHKII